MTLNDGLETTFGVGNDKLVTDAGIEFGVGLFFKSTLNKTKGLQDKLSSAKLVVQEIDKLLPYSLNGRVVLARSMGTHSFRNSAKPYLELLDTYSEKIIGLENTIFKRNFIHGSSKIGTGLRMKTAKAALKTNENEN